MPASRFPPSGRVTGLGKPKIYDLNHLLIGIYAELIFQARARNVTLQIITNQWYNNSLMPNDFRKCIDPQWTTLNLIILDPFPQCT